MRRNANGTARPLCGLWNQALDLTWWSRVRRSEQYFLRTHNNWLPRPIAIHTTVLILDVSSLSLLSLFTKQAPERAFTIHPKSVLTRRLLADPSFCWSELVHHCALVDSIGFHWMDWIMILFS